MRGLTSVHILLLIPLLVAGAFSNPAKPVKSTASENPSRFEGILDMRLTMETGSGDLELSLSGDLAKLDMLMTVNPMPMPIRLAVLLDAKAPKTAYLVSDMTKTYSSINLAEAAPSQDAQNKKARGKFRVKQMGQEKILGFFCSHVTLTRDKELIDAWITKDMPDVYAVLKRLQEANPEIGEAELFKALEETGNAGLPMRCIVVRDGQRVTTEVRKVERKSLPASLFAIPKDYTRTEGGGAPSGGAGGLQPTPEQVEQMKRILQGAVESK